MIMAGMGGTQVFSQAVGAVMKEWPALKIAVDNNFGGPMSRQKATWLEQVTVDFMCNNDGVQSWELEDYLSVLMDQEFNTSIEDASMPMVSKKICDLYNQFRLGNLKLIQDFISKSQPAPSVEVQCMDQDDEEVEEILDDIVEGEEDKDHTVEEDLEQLKIREDGEEKETNEDADDDEGWEVVTRRNRKKK